MLSFSASKSLHVDGVLIGLNRNARTTLLPKGRFPLTRNTPPSLISPLETLRLASFAQSPSRPSSLSFTSKARPPQTSGHRLPHPVIPYLTDSISRPCTGPAPVLKTHLVFSSHPQPSRCCSPASACLWSLLARLSSLPWPLGLPPS